MPFRCSSSCSFSRSRNCDVEPDHRGPRSGDAQRPDARTVDVPDRVARTTGRIFDDPSSQTFDDRHAVRDIESLPTAATTSVDLVLSVLSDVRYGDILHMQTMLGEFLFGFCKKIQFYLPKIMKAQNFEFM